MKRVEWKKRGTKMKIVINCQVPGDRNKKF